MLVQGGQPYLAYPFSKTSLQQIIHQLTALQYESSRLNFIVQALGTPKNQQILCCQFLVHVAHVNPRGQCYKTFYCRNLLMLVDSSSVFFLARHFQPSLMFVGEARSLPDSGVSYELRLGYKDRPWTNTLALGYMLLVLRFVWPLRSSWGQDKSNEWKGSNRKQNARWQHISRLKTCSICIW